jgi:hypothetical protein
VADHPYVRKDPAVKTAEVIPLPLVQAEAKVIDINARLLAKKQQLEQVEQTIRYIQGLPGGDAA